MTHIYICVIFRFVKQQTRGNNMNKLQQISSIIILITTTLAGVLSLIEKSQKIKWKPITKLLGNDEILKKMDKLDNKVDIVVKRQDDLERQSHQKEYSEIREKILNFASDIHNGVGKTRQQYKEFFDKLLPRYDELVKTLNLTNGWAREEIAFVKRNYRDLDKK